MTLLAPPFINGNESLPPDPSWQIWAPETGFTAEDVSAARRAVGIHIAAILLGEFGVVDEELVDNAKLAFTEIATNGLRYRLTGFFAGSIPANPEQGTRAQVYIGIGDGTKGITPDPNRPAGLAPDKAEWGRGLLVADAVSDKLVFSAVEEEDTHPDHRNEDFHTQKLAWAAWYVPDVVGPSNQPSIGLAA